jgi:hypothetical protein
LIVEKLPFLLLAIVSSVIAFFAQRLAGAMPSSSQVSFSTSVDNALLSYVRYLGKTLWPHHLCIYYPYRVELADWQVVGAVVILALITLAAWRQWRHRPYLIFGWLWFLGTLVPVIGLVQVGAQCLADRYMYIPSIGLFVMIVWGLKDFLGPWSGTARWVGAAIAVAVLLGCGIATVRQLRYWRDGEAMFRRALAVTTDNMMAEYGYGEVLVKRGEVDAGLQHLQRAVQINPQCFPAYVRIADLWSRQGKIRESIEEYRKALRYEPDLAVALNNLAWILATNDDPQFRDGAEAVRLAERACRFMQYQRPIYVGSELDTLAAAYAEAGRFEDAVKTAEHARSLALAIGQKNKAEKIGQSLELYRAGKPLHQTIEKLKQ